MEPELGSGTTIGVGVGDGVAAVVHPVRRRREAAITASVRAIISLLTLNYSSLAV